MPKKTQIPSPISLRLPADLCASIQRIAASLHLSQSELIRLCLYEFLPLVEKNGLTLHPKPSKTKHT